MLRRGLVQRPLGLPPTLHTIPLTLASRLPRCLQQTLWASTRSSPPPSYSDTMTLPRTDFPLRANAAQRDAGFRARCTDSLYTWQVGPRRVSLTPSPRHSP